jgi:O-antigen/teichoic acid export membrane protein
MSRAGRILRGFGIGLLNQGLTSIVGLWLTRFVLHRIGDRDYALWLVAGQCIGFLSLVDLGVTALLPREVAAISGLAVSPEARDQQLRDVIGTSAALVLALAPILVLASLGLLVFLPNDWVIIRGPIALALGTLVVSYVLRTCHAVLSGLQDFSFLAWVDTASWVTNSVTTVVLAASGVGLYSLAIGAAAGQLVAASAWVARIAMSHRSVVPDRLPRVNLRANLRRMMTGMSVSLNNAAHLLLNSADIIVIGRTLGPAATLRYSFTDKVQTLVNNQPYMIADLAGPALAQVRASEKPERFTTAVGALAGVVLVFSGGIAIPILAGNHAFVRVWIGEQHFGGLVLTALLVANMIVRHLQFSFGVAVFYAGRVREITILSLADGVASLVLTIILVRAIGIAGAPLASIVSCLTMQTPWTLVLLGREMRRSVLSVLAPLLPWFTRFVPIVALAWAAGSWLGPRSDVGAAAAAAVLAAAYGLTMLPLLKRPPFDMYANRYLSKFASIRRRLLGTPEGT